MAGKVSVREARWSAVVPQITALILWSDRQMPLSFRAAIYAKKTPQKPNCLNVVLQGRDKTAADLVEPMHAFWTKLTDLSTGGMLHFPTQIPHHRCDDRFPCETGRELCQSIGQTLPYQSLSADNETSSQLTQKANFILEPFDAQVIRNHGAGALH